MAGKDEHVFALKGIDALIIILLVMSSLLGFYLGVKAEHGRPLVKAANVPYSPTGCLWLDEEAGPSRGAQSGLASTESDVPR